MVEQYGYPLEKSVKGIDFRHIQEITAPVYVVSESGKKLECDFYDQEINIADAEDSDFYMTAIVREDGVLALDLQTKKDGVLHPDMYAARFIGFALEYFAKKGIDIHAFKGEWEEGKSINYTQFIEKYNPLLNNRAEAARSTWTGRVMARYGFSSINNCNVAITKEKSGSKTIHSYFKRHYSYPKLD